MVSVVVRRRATGLGLAGLLLAAAGCQSGVGGLDLGLSRNQSAAEETQKITQEELRAYCPPVTLREASSVLRSFAKGGDGDASKLQYQASISDATRACTRADGTMTINVAVAGRVITGPAGAGGTVTLPIRVAVTRGEEVLYSQVHQHQVTFSATGAAQFIFSDPNVMIPIPEPRTVQVIAGFDEGPPRRQ